MIVEGDVKEIAALVLATQEQRKIRFTPCDAKTSHMENPCTVGNATD